jgi:phosphotransferase system enzyme I (PtsI)
MIYKGNPVSQGIGIGQIYIYETFVPSVVKNVIEQGDAGKVIDTYESIRNKAHEELLAVKRKMTEDENKAKIFSAHIDILYDPAIDNDIRDAIGYDCLNVDWAIYKTYEKYIRIMEKTKDPLIRERKADLQDVQFRLLRCLYSLPEKNLAFLDMPVVVVSHDLLPSDTAMLDPAKTLAIITETGGYTSHSAIIARNFGIPALSGVQNCTSVLKQSDTVIVDAIEGLLITDPDKEQIESYNKIQKKYALQVAEIKEYLDMKPVTSDGVPIEVDLNIGSADARELEGSQYTDGVGLFRTEFLFMGQNRLPTEDEQHDVYKKVLLKFGSRPVTLRTLDIGGDKTLEYLNLPKEENPFLGHRALRLCFDNLPIFKTQLRAALRASIHGNLRIMFPMVANMEDIRRAKTILEEVKNGLDTEKVPYSRDLKIGIMIEIPSIALIADSVVKEVDFASIGTNDLAQYTIAVDRMNPKVSGYYQVYHPALFRLIGYVAEQFVKEGKPICVCGEMGGDAAAAVVLLGMGIRQLSMSIASVGKIKKLISSLNIEQAAKVFDMVKNFSTAAEAEEYIKNSIADII